MISGLLKRVFGSSNDRALSQLKLQVDAINALEAEIESLSDDAVRAQTDVFRIKS